MTLAAYVGGIGVLGPGFNDWPQTAAVLRGARAYEPAATVLPPPSLLPSVERRRTGRVVKLALAVATEAVASAAVDPTELASVFSSSGSDGHILNEICQALALSPRQVSPTRFSNSVHNAAAGYWSIATGATAESNVLCAFDASFAAGLLEAMAQTAVDCRPLLLVAYDTEYPPPLHAKRPMPDAFGIAMVLTPRRQAGSLARIEIELCEDPCDNLADPAMEALRSAIPAARGLPLLKLLALGEPGRTVLEYLDVARACIRVDPCR